MRFALPSAFLAPLAATAFLATTALAHGPTPQKVDQSIAIAAKPDAVWAVVGDFAGISNWHPDVAKSVGTGGNASGGRRTLTLKNGGTLDEGLDEWDAAKRSYSYRLGDADLKALPVSSYSATITVSPDGEGSKVEWLGRFYRGDTGNEPPEELSDAAGKDAMNLYFSNGLKGLKARLEGKTAR
ncbi:MULTISPECIES: SRPBCC family protein [unclassified Methylobacterium]|uniref:SRPBCC family protein n=1 Tax=unclassified Methylobacterium TaxID=2615210 RepID=UPI0006FE4DDC|nr:MULTISPECIES: SRPBCC family protein [unclassified Methylobacterium]KQO52064.1 MxaD protein [Methylobacterium sp. Leaf86]KQO90451.1 MxaD protein [Methylobacterium sp. Leaf91]MBO1018827.1 SRPBCC family protein [Methylobacterium sp. SD274]